MKSFQITETQIAGIIGAAAADELSRRFNRHFDFLTIAAWASPETPLGAGGLDLNGEEREACIRRIADFFGMDDAPLADPSAERIADWAAATAQAVSTRLERFSFKSAARDARDGSCVHAAEDIFQDAAAAANLLYGRRRLLSFVAPHSLLGFELSVLTPNLLRIDAVDARGMTPEALSQTLKFGDVLVATPSLWRYMMRETLTAPDNVMAVSFGEPMTPDLAVEMRKSGFGVMRELYGSTETGLVGWRDAPADPFLLCDHWRRSEDALMREGADGRARAITAMDVIEWIDERRFRLLGRKDGAVQIGAVNVFPDEVARALRGHDMIAACEVVDGRRGDGVNRLIANIVLEKGAAPNERTARDIDAWCRRNLRQQERPRIYNFVDALDARPPAPPVASTPAGTGKEPHTN